MKKVAFVLVLLLCGTQAMAQEPSKFSAFVGGAINAENQLRPAGTAGLLTALNDRMVSFTGLTVRGITERQPVSSAVQGLLVRVQDTERLDVYAAANGGVAQSVEILSGDFQAGGVVAYKLRDGMELFLGLSARAAPAAGGVSPLILLGLHFGGN